MNAILLRCNKFAWGASYFTPATLYVCSFGLCKDQFSICICEACVLCHLKQLLIKVIKNK